jgi:phosphatidylserine/phosphatidylglycerophosphate/cardiolipin synthase-like enzyme
MRKSAWLLTVVLLSITSLVASAAAYVPPGGGTFNTPRPWGSDKERYRIVRTIEKAFNKIRPTKEDPRPVILVSTYLLDRNQSVDALVDACRWGVAVRVILDEDIDNRNSRRLITMLNGDNVPDKNGDGVPDRKPRARKCNRPLRHDRAAAVPHTRLLSLAEARRSVRKPRTPAVTWGKDGSYVKVCDGACRGAGGNMHSKFFAFTNTGKSKNVVMVSSSNLNEGGALLGWNDLYVMKRRPASFAGYKDIHRQMTDDKRARGRKVEIKDGPFTSRFFPMRNAKRSNDPTLADLNRIGCSSAFGRTQIHVSMFFWKGSRGNYLTDKLLRLARRGCRVSIIYGAPSVQMAERLRDAARAGTIDLYDSRWDFNNDGFNEVRTHAKYVLVKGTVGKDRSSHQVWTGSQNWVAGSLSRGDEVSLNIAKRSAYRDYIRNWATIRNHARKLPYHRPAGVARNWTPIAKELSAPPAQR